MKATIASFTDWPPQLSPTRCPVYARNEITIPVAPYIIWAWLCQATRWPTWYRHIQDVRIDGELALNKELSFHTLGASIQATVRVFEPERKLAWEGRAVGVSAFHTWVFQPTQAGTYVITEETNRGPLPWLLRWYIRRTLHNAHQEWIESLARMAIGGLPVSSG